jgi:hypothetical protein
MRVVIVTGSRKWLAPGTVTAALDEHAPDLVVHGGCYVGVRPRVCLGADYWAHRWCSTTDTDEYIFRAKWSHGKKAGPLRNKAMLLAYPNAVVLAFPLGGPGTADCMRQAKRLGMRVIEHAYPEAERTS